MIWVASPFKEYFTSFLYHKHSHFDLTAKKMWSLLPHGFTGLLQLLEIMDPSELWVPVI